QVTISRFVNCTPSSFQSKNSNEINNTKNELDSNKSISSSKFWTNSETQTLFSFLSNNFDLYHKNKSKFYAAATINIDKINELFGNRKNVNSDYLISSIDNDK
ncbi:17891_t:CDS:2, partial [Cetraspora pellucida]